MTGMAMLITTRLAAVTSRAVPVLKPISAHPAPHHPSPSPISDIVRHSS